MTFRLGQDRLAIADVARAARGDTAPLHAAIRARLPPRTEDREPGPDVEAVAEVLDRFA
ncbi:hypothetical protein [Falsiroseomonas sp. HW251]|uniref:hypothetical protein n=1 Tax=Falsiroseomonas sp. HW251 TaxID=3390998 RepID=UPI003D31EFE2